MNGMSRESWTELTSVVDEVVSPLHAGTARKRRMSEELLGHLSSLFEVEFQRLGNEAEALAEAKHRFGEPQSLSRDLRKTLPWWERLRYVCEPIWSMLGSLRWESGESVGHFVGKHLLISPIWGVLRLINGFARYGELPETRWLLQIGFGTGIAVAAVLIGLIMCLTDFSRRLFGNESQKSVWGAVVIAPLGLVILPLLMWAVLSGLLNEFLPFHSIERARVASLYLFPVLTLVLLFMIARQVAAETRSRRKLA